MELDSSSTANVQVYKHSWTIYIRTIFSFLIFMMLGTGVFLVLVELFSALKITTLLKPLTIIAYIIAALIIISYIYDLLLLKSLRLWIDNEGVWLFRGILPWSKGTTGTTWRDISDAHYVTGFMSWITKSYTIRVAHRFTKTSEITSTHIKNGNLVVIEINKIIKSKYSNKE